MTEVNIAQTDLAVGHRNHEPRADLRSTLQAGDNDLPAKKLTPVLTPVRLGQA